MKTKLLITLLMFFAFAGINAQDCGTLMLQDTFPDDGAIPAEWTEYNTSGQVTVEGGRLKFDLTADIPSAYRSFDAQSNNLTFSFDVESTRNWVKARVNLLSSDGKYITGLMIGNDGIKNIQYATALDASSLPGSYTGKLINGNYNKNTTYTVSVSVNFEKQTLDFYQGDNVGATSIPFLEAATDIAKIDIQQISMYANEGRFFFDNITLKTLDVNRTDLAEAIIDAQADYESYINSLQFGYSYEAYDALEELCDDANVYLVDCATTQAEIDSVLALVLVAKSTFDDSVFATVDRSVLDSVISATLDVYEIAIISPLYGYSRENYNAVKSACESAATYLYDFTLTQEEMDAMVASIAAAEEDFENSYKDEVVLKMYSGYNFIGAERTYKCGYYNGNLGDFEDIPVSFKLEKGYMATFAQDVDGMGFSKVYIAQDSALSINLPKELQQTISFMRVSPWFAVSKKGALGNHKWTTSDNYNTQWYYNWGLGQPEQTSGYCSAEVQHVSMSWSAADKFTNKDKLVVVGQNLARNHHMAFNEPDNSGQSNMTVEQALTAYPKLLKTGLRLGAPGVENIEYNPNKDMWADDAWIVGFMDSCIARGYRVDFIPVHVYVRFSTAQYMERFKALYDRYQIPLWVTEYNYGNPNMGSPNVTLDKGYKNIKALTDAMEAADYIERYNWYYFFGESTGIGGMTGGELNITGQYYRDLESKNPSYQQEVYEDGPYIETGIETQLAEEVGITIFPNPVTNGIINLSFENGISPFTLSLYDVSGKEVLFANNIYQLNVANLKNGFYMLRIKNAEMDAVQKIIIRN